MKKAFLFTSVLLVCILFFVSCELTGTAPSKGTLHVVAIGNNFEKVSNQPRKVTYKDVEYTLNEIDSCRNDADAVCQVLEYLGNKSGMNTDVVNLSEKYLADFEAALDSVVLGAGPDDLTVIFVSTHGGNPYNAKLPYSESNSDNSFFALEKNNTEVECGYMECSTLKEYAQEISGTVLILADFCHSGSLIAQDNFTYNKYNYTDSNGLQLLFDSTPATDSNKMFVLSASSYYQNSYTGKPFDLPLSLFTWYFLKALGMSGYNTSTHKVSISDSPVLKHDRIILSDIYCYVYKATSSSQTPQMNTGANDLILFSL